MTRMTLLLTFVVLLAGGTVATGISKKTAPLIRVKPDKALVDEVVGV